MYSIFTIYSNTDLWKSFSEAAVEELRRDGHYKPSKEMIREKIEELDKMNLEEVLCVLDRLFDNDSCLMLGTTKDLNTGVSKKSRRVMSGVRKAIMLTVDGSKYFQIYDYGGHLYLECLCNGRVCTFELRRVTSNGYQYLQGWRNGQGAHAAKDKDFIFTQIINSYSKLPWFVKTIYGCNICVER